LPTQFLVGHRLVLRFERADCFDLRLQMPQESRIGRTEHAGNRPLKAAQNSIAEPGDDFPNTFQNFHE
jgi:hypothetical protein